MKQNETRSFLVLLVSPVLPVAAVLIFNRIENALPLLIASIVILTAVIVAIVTLLKGNAKFPGMKAFGTLFGVLGILVTGIVGLIAGWTLTKI